MSKLVSMREAVSEWVPDGASVLLGAGLEGLIPFAAGHEIIRQRKRELTVLAPISDMLFDQMIGAGCVATVRAAWVGNVSAGLGHCFRRAAEQGQPHPIETLDYSNLTFALALQAGAQGVPYLPTRSVLGSDLLQTNRDFKVVQSPFGTDQLVAVRALVPDVAFISVQRADSDGAAHAWGALGVALEGCAAARHVVIVADEIVDRDVILSDPNRILTPAFRVSAVVHEPFGCHPSPVQGFYGRDHAAYHEYHQETRSADGAQAWLDEWVHGVPDRVGYLSKLGEGRLQSLRAGEQRLAAAVDYGF